MDGLLGVTDSLANQEHNRAEWHRQDFNALKQGQTKLFELLSSINGECKGCSAKNQHIQTLERLLDRETHYFHDLNRSIHVSTGIVPGNNIVSGNKNEEVPLGRGTTSFEDLRQRAEEASRKLAKERNPEADKAEQHWRGKGATSIPNSNIVQPDKTEVNKEVKRILNEDRGELINHPGQTGVITNIEDPTISER